MSRTLKNQVLTMIHLLQRANRTLKISLKARPVHETEILQMLSVCQETAVAIGNKFEKIYGEDTESVHKLEDYCECLYQLSSVLTDSKKSRELLAQLTRQLRELHFLIGSQISDKWEALFLPYQSSMWSSMEKIWNVISAAENFDTCFVPIPYYERNIDGTFGKYSYEGANFPDDVPITYYENYDLQDHWPDLIFTFDLYNQENSAYSIDPRFYSQILKESAEILIYVSSLTPEDLLSNSQKVMDEAIYFCNTENLFRIKRVFVQSENIRQIYLDTLVKKWGQTIGESWTQKILCVDSFHPEMLL
ncbi:MAG: hypothetical protein HFH24_08975 [Ruminococcus sp.]|nr:hypothetical protein [Ruminococcus sp.]